MGLRTCKDLVSKGSVDITLQLNAEATAKAKNGEKIINATIGMLFDDNGVLVSPSFVDKYLESSFTLENKRYGNTSGDQDALEEMFKWSVGKYYHHIVENYEHGKIFTPGGSGALSLAFRTYASIGDKILLPSICWINYAQMVNQRNCKSEYYEFYDAEGNFNIADVCLKTSKLLDEQGNALVLINDPCENPTGYSMSKDEWIKLIKGFNALADKGNITILLDTAYIDIGSGDSRLFYSLLDELDSRVMTLVVTSASKTLGLYGLRGGALFAISRSKEDIEEFKKVTSDASRAIWSAVNVPLLASLKEIYNEENESLLNSHMESIVGIIEKRSELLLKRFKEYGVNHLPYRSGFFIVIPTKDGTAFANKLRERNIYVLPIAHNYVRIAICSMSYNDIEEFALAVKECL